MRNYLKILAISLIATPLTAFAHVRWFAHPEGYVPPYQLTDKPVIGWIIGAILIVLIGIYLEKKISTPQWIKRRLERWAPIAFSAASIGFGLSLIIFSLKGFIFAPNLPAHDPALLTFQLIAGVMICLGIFERMGALLLLLVFIFGIGEYGAYEMLDTLEMVGFALFTLIVGRPKLHIIELTWVNRFINRFSHYGLPLLRVGTGLNLMVLGLSEKILTPSLTQDFLTRYDWNFLSGLGVSNYWFAFSAGIVEFLFGLFLVLGLLTRTTTLALAGFLITTLIALGPVELIGHLPHFSIAIVLLTIGSGDRLKFWPHHA